MADDTVQDLLCEAIPPMAWDIRLVMLELTQWLWLLRRRWATSGGSATVADPVVAMVVVTTSAGGGDNTTVAKTPQR